MLASSDVARVAVVIPVYRATYLAEVLDSVFLQSRPPDEVIVVDDGSPDRLLLQQAVAPYAGRLTLLHQENQGAGAARNAGIAATQARFIATLDADDRWLPDFLRDQLGAFEADPTLDLIYADGLIVGRSPLAGRTFMTMCPSRGEVTLDALLAQRCNVLLSAVVVRRAAVMAVGGFDPALRRGQDFDLWLRMARAGAHMGYAPRVMMLRRVHDNNLSGAAIDEIERPLRVFEKTLNTMSLTAAQRRIAQARVAALQAELARERGKELLKRGEFGAARHAFAGAEYGLAAWKLHATRLGLRLAPHLVRRLYLARLASAPS
jgi:glycosyltransferase involved in cell wall biosynthesis